jgi:quercetin dioxygenase-like cupin family protein
MSNDHLVGDYSSLKPLNTPNANLVNTELYELISPKIHGTDYTINILKIMPGGLVKEQSHVEHHAIMILNGTCNILLGKEWVSVKKGNYLYIPPDMTHCFSNNGPVPAEVLILKK